jgi:hypothetical protein
MAQLVGPQPPVSFPWFDPKTGKPTQAFGQYMAALDQLVRGFTAGQAGLINAANDAAAATAGVKIGQLYRATNAVQIRLV